jgi:hypothetical protein
MPQKIEEIKVVTIDDHKILVEDLPKEAQILVGDINNWRAEEANLLSNLRKLQLAMRSAQNEIVNIVNKQKEQKTDS